MLSVVTDDGATQSGPLSDETVREDARRMPAAALEAEANRYLTELATGTDDHGRRLVVSNGHLAHSVVTAAGKRVESPQARRRAITGAHLVLVVRAGARFKDGVLIEREGAAA
ncbi:hypothetical protein OHB00_37465 [Streptomyces sp. NBC_00631]|uniref:hypothetical protein n=1 Tax=Streptomyces sp. NBC_00631 TaxID=2975793 RepID=UPI0030E5447E